MGWSSNSNELYEAVETLSTSMYRSLMEAGEKVLADRYSKYDVPILELLWRCLKDETTTKRVL